MRKLTVLAALALGSAAVPADAAIVRYGLQFTQTSFYEDPRDPGGAAGIGTPTGYFDYDTSLNSAVFFAIAPGYPVFDENGLGRQTLALVTAAGPCDLTCLTATLSGTFRTDIGFDRSSTSLSFGSPIGGFASLIGPGPQRPVGIAGTFSVSGPVPEPGTWALMLLGFGAIGSALRRGRRPAVSCA